MRAWLIIVVLIGPCGQVAEAVQVCHEWDARIAPDSRYTDNGNGTVTDNQTGLMWKQCSEGQSGEACAGTATPMTWSDALAAGANSNFAGFDDWRLPNIKELTSLVETGCYSPAINESRFPNTVLENYAAYYMSSSTSLGVNAPDVVYRIEFSFGSTTVLSKSEVFYMGAVRLVRGGP